MPSESTPKRKGKKAADKEAGAEELDLVPNSADWNQHFVRWLEKAKLRGMEVREQVWDLVVRKGLSQNDAADILGITRQRVNQLYLEMRREAIARAPRSAEDFAGMREELAERIFSVIEDANKFPSDYRYLAIRLKANEQLAALYGLQLKQENDKAKDGGADAPEAIAADVAKLLADVHGRAKDIQEAKAGIERDVTP